MHWHCHAHTAVWHRNKPLGNAAEEPVVVSVGRDQLRARSAIECAKPAAAALRKLSDQFARRPQACRQASLGCTHILSKDARAYGPRRLLYFGKVCASLAVLYASPAQPCLVF